MNALLAWYRGREPREQRVLLAGAIAVPVLIVLFSLLWLRQVAAAAEARVAQKQQDLAWLQVVVPQLLAQQQRNGGNRPNESLVVMADRVARESGLTLSSAEPGGNGALRVRADKVSFDSVALWLGQMTQRYGVSIDNASIDATDADGIVNATLVMRGH